MARRIGHAENASNARSTSGTGLSGLPIMVRPNLMSGRSWSWLSGTFVDRPPPGRVSGLVVERLIRPHHPVRTMPRRAAVVKLDACELREPLTSI